MLRRHYVAAAAPAPAPSRSDSPYIDVEPTKKTLLRTGAVVRLKAFPGPFGICDAFDAKSNLWAVRFFGETGLEGLERSGPNHLIGEGRLVGPLDDVEALDEATRAEGRVALLALAR